ncbi:hypothetical protein AB0284_21840 [Pseudarthrobacter phenanthrenivorans]|uniref:hypothetical protein n=1 Tax=Pseudarthrobacter phenanthrenivorans TaxID=361575 RepID=UPI00344D7AB3
MRTKIAVHAEPDIAPFARSITSSLPQSFELGTSEADFVVLTGTGDWDLRAAEQLAGAGRTVVVHDPQPIEPDRLAMLNDHLNGGRVVLSETYAGNPALAQLLDRGAATLEATHTIATFGVVELDVSSGLLQQLRILRVLGVENITIDDDQRRGRTALVTARGSRSGREVLLRLQVAQSSSVRPSHTVRAYSAEGIATIELPASDTARAAIVTLTGPEGALRLPDIYEHAHRATWRQAHQGHGQGAPADQLLAFEEDLRVLASS